MYAADDGYVSTVMYQKWGIGYALFLTHPDGRRTFYGHLDRFADRVLANSTVAKYGPKILDREDFRLEFERDDIPVRGGERIVIRRQRYRGHFHFEVRMQKAPLNPLRNGLIIEDTIAPFFSISVFFLSMGVACRWSRRGT